MAKKSSAATKKKGPKGKKARAKAKLNRQWGEVDQTLDDGDGKTKHQRRRGKSRLLQSSKFEGSKKTGEDGRYSSDNEMDMDDDDDSHDGSDGSSVNDPISGLLRSIHAASSKSSKAKRKTKSRRVRNHDDDTDDDSSADDRMQDDQDDELSGREEDNDNADINEISNSEEDVNGTDHDDDDDDDDDDDPNETRTEMVDLFGDYFGFAPAVSDKDKSTSSCKVALDDDSQYQLTTYTKQNEAFIQSLCSDKKKGTAKLARDEWKQLSATAFQCNRKLLQKRWNRMYKRGMPLSHLQGYPFLSRYMDMLLLAKHDQTKEERDQAQQLVTLHMMNHILTTRGRISRNDKRIKDAQAKADNHRNDDDDDDNDGANDDATKDEPDMENLRDQGFTRPTVLIMMPTRGTCYQFIKKMMTMLGVDIGKEYGERFEADYGPMEEEGPSSQHGMGQEQADAAAAAARRKQVLKQKGQEWLDMFGDEVNQDDDFKIGIALSPRSAADKDGNARNGGMKRQSKTQAERPKVSMKLYTDFYRSDIIVASPLGLKMMISPSGEDDGGDDDGDDDNYNSNGRGGQPYRRKSTSDADFLSSIEICYLGFGDVLMMQNWDHINDVLALLNQQPTKNNDTDFSRVRNYLLDDQASTRRQLIVSSKIIDPCILSTFKQHAKSIAGSVITRHKIPAESAMLGNILLPLRQVFQKVNAATLVAKNEARLSYFLKTLLPQIQRMNQKRTMIYVPSYFDFCSLRNAFLKKKVAFVSVTEYSRGTEVSRGRARFLQGRKPIMVYTGRAHFFHRHLIKGVRHLIFFGLPEHPEFYADQVNLLQTTPTGGMDNGEDGEDDDDDDGIETMTTTSCMALFTKYDSHALERIVGTSNCKRMIASQKSTFMFYS